MLTTSIQQGFGKDSPRISFPDTPKSKDFGKDSSKADLDDVAMDIYAALASQWKAVAAGAQARQALQDWAEVLPALGGFASPAELVATIGHQGDPASSCALLSDLLVIAGDDDFAVQAVLQSVLPGLRGAARRRWEHSATGPWRTADEVAADALSAGCHAIRVHAGQRHKRPAAVIVRAVEGRLRHTHDNWCKQAAHLSAAPTGALEPSQSATEAAFSAERQATALIAEAVRAQVIDPTQASIVFAVGVLGHTVADAARTAGVPSRAAYRLLGRAQAALRAWLDNSPDLDGPVRSSSRDRHRGPSVPSPTRVDDAQPSPFTGLDDDEPSEDSPMTPLLHTPTEAARLLAISRSKLYTLIRAGEIDSVTIDTCRRIPHRDLIDYIERLRHPPGPGAAGKRPVLPGVNRLFEVPPRPAGRAERKLAG